MITITRVSSGGSGTIGETGGDGGGGHVLRRRPKPPAPLCTQFTSRYSGGTRPALGERTPIAQKNGRYEVPKQALETSNPVNSLKIKAYDCTSLGF